MKKYQCISLLLSLLLIFSFTFTSYADFNDLMIRSESNTFMVNTDSNALMTLELEDSDYAVMPLSSFGSVVNTVDMNHVYFAFYVRNPVTGADYTINKNGTIIDSGKRVVLNDSEILEGYYINNIQFYLRKGALPPVGKYVMSFDWSNQFSFDNQNSFFIVNRQINNATSLNDTFSINEYVTSGSGDIYLSNVNVDLKSISQLGYYTNISFYDTSKLRYFDGVLSVAFTPTNETPAITLGTEISSNEYQSDVSSSLSDLSSSVDDLGEGISGVTEAIQNLQGAMEPHYSNVLTQLHHITEQLHAFYDQVYNNIHLKEYALWQDIKTAIENIDLEVNVNLDKLKTSIDNMSTAVQNKLQSVTDTITGGFDNSGIEQNGNELDSSITEFEEAEQNVLESVNDSLNDFEFDADLSEYKNIVQVISDFLQELYNSSGGFKLVINLSLMLSVASIVIGVYRFKEGG